jgi:hypothetical protein
MSSFTTRQRLFVLPVITEKREVQEGGPPPGKGASPPAEARWDWDRNLSGKPESSDKAGEPFGGGGINQSTE